MLEGWTDDMYQIRRSRGDNYFDILFIVQVLIGYFLILNLMIAVQFMFLEEAFNDLEDKKLKEVARAKAELDFNAGGEN